MPFSPKEEGDVETLVDTLSMEEAALSEGNLAALTTTDLQQLDELSDNLDMSAEPETEVIESEELDPDLEPEHLEPDTELHEETTVEDEDLHEMEVETIEEEVQEEEIHEEHIIQSEDDMEIETEIHSEEIIETKPKGLPPLRPLTIAPKPVQMKQMVAGGQQLLFVQGGSGGQQIKLVTTSGQNINLSNLSLAKQIALKGSIKQKTISGKTLLAKMQKGITKKPQVMYVQKSEPQLKLIQTSSANTTIPPITKTITLAQAQQMGIIGTKSNKQLFINKTQSSKGIKIIPQVRSPTKILPAPQTSTGKQAQRIYIKTSSSGGTVMPNQIIQMAGGQSITSGLHQINIPGKGVQYIKFVTQPEAAETLAGNITMAKVHQGGGSSKIIPLTVSSGSTLKTVQLSDLKHFKQSTPSTSKLTFTKSTPKYLQTSTSSSSLVMLSTTGGVHTVATTTSGVTTQSTASGKVSLATIPSGMVIRSLQGSKAAVLGGGGGTETVPSEEVIKMENNGMRPRKPCNCTKSQCLKLYCDCFANGEFCYMCNCMNCNNNINHEEYRQRAIRNCLERNPNAFRPKIGKARDMISPRSGDGGGGNAGGSGYLSSGSSGGGGSTSGQMELGGLGALHSSIGGRHHSGGGVMVVGGGSGGSGSGTGQGSGDMMIPVRRHTKGCNCKRSSCLKNYCECYEAKIGCSANCKCIGCRNVEIVPGTRYQPNYPFMSVMSGGHQNSSKMSLMQEPLSLRPKKINPIKQPFNFMTNEVIEATSQCLLAISDNAESLGQREELTKTQIIQEFGRCLKQIIDCAQTTKNVRT